MARQGEGIALLPAVVLPGDTWTRDEAVLILPETVGTSITIWLVAPTALKDTEAVRVIVEESKALMGQLRTPR